MSAPLVVVGASLAGLRTIEELRTLGWPGEVVLIGDEARTPYDRPPLSKGFLTGEVSLDSLILADTARCDELDVRLRTGVPATGLDPEARCVHLADGSKQPYGHVVIATGSAPRQATWERPLDGLTPLRTLEDAIRLRTWMRDARHLVIVGSGFIGTEVAATARGLGLEVTVLELDPHPLRRLLGDAVGDQLRDFHESRGVTFRGGVRVTELIGTDRVEGAVLDDGSTIEGDLVLSAIGSDPAVQWLADSGLDLGPGVRCDDNGQAAPGVWAVGDVASHGSGPIAHWTDAVESARAVARDIMRSVGAEAPATRASLPYFWTDQYEHKLQSVGAIPGHDACRILAGSIATGDLFAVYGRGGNTVAAVAVNRPRDLARARRSISSGAPLESVSLA